MSSRRVLVVDDNEDVTEMLSVMIAMDGHEVRTANAGRDALTTASSFQPDVILLDIAMPDLDGFEVCARLRIMAQCSRSLIVALTGWAHPSLQEQTLAAGFDSLFRKPVTLAELRALLVTPKRTLP